MWWGVVMLIGIGIIFNLDCYVGDLFEFIVYYGYEF